MKFCTSCGKPNDDNAMFCVVCGARQNVDVAPNQPQNENNNSAQINFFKDNGSISNVQESVVPDNQQNNQPTGFVPNNQQNGFAQDNAQNNFVPNNQQNDFAQGNYTDGFVNTNQSVNPNEPAPQQFNQFGEPQQPVKKKSKAPLIIGLSVNIVVVIVAIVLVIIFLGGGNKNSAEGAAKGYLDALAKLDMKKMASYVAYSSEYKDEFEDFEDDLSDDMSYLQSIKITYKISGTKKLSKSAVEDFWDDYDWEVYVDEDDISNLTLVKAKVTMSFLGQKESRDVEIYVGKYKGKWKVIYSDMF